VDAGDVAYRGRTGDDQPASNIAIAQTCNQNQQPPARVCPVAPASLIRRRPRALTERRSFDHLKVSHQSGMGACRDYPTRPGPSQSQPDALGDQNLFTGAPSHKLGGDRTTYPMATKSRLSGETDGLVEWRIPGRSQCAETSVSAAGATWRSGTSICDRSANAMVTACKDADCHRLAMIKLEVHRQSIANQRALPVPRGKEPTGPCQRKSRYLPRRHVPGDGCSTSASKPDKWQLNTAI